MCQHAKGYTWQTSTQHYLKWWNNQINPIPIRKEWCLSIISIHQQYDTGNDKTIRQEKKFKGIHIGRKGQIILIWKYLKELAHHLHPVNMKQEDSIYKLEPKSLAVFESLYALIWDIVDTTLTMLYNIAFAKLHCWVDGWKLLLFAMWAFFCLRYGKHFMKSVLI